METDYHKNTDDEVRLIKSILQKYYINVDERGKIYYEEKRIHDISPACILYFMRHADTIGTIKKQFMSENSENSHITSDGRKNIRQELSKIDLHHIDLILYSDVVRVQETAKEVLKNIECNLKVVVLPWLKGIDNGGWEGKNIACLDGMDKADFQEREVLHNIFAKSSHGTSWGEVMVNADKLISYLTHNCSGKNVLLISQESLIFAFKILLRQMEKPWEEYETDEFFGLSGKNDKDYGRIQRIL